MLQGSAGSGEAGHCPPTLLTTQQSGERREEDRITISYHLRSGAAAGLQLDIGIHWLLAYAEPQVTSINDTEDGNTVFASHHCPVFSCIEVPTEVVTAAY